MTESDRDPLTLPAQLETKIIPCMPKRRLKHYIGLVTLNHLASVQSSTCLTVQASVDGHG